MHPVVILVTFVIALVIEAFVFWTLNGVRQAERTGLPPSMGYPGILLRLGGSKAFLSLVILGWMMRAAVLVVGYLYFGSVLKTILFYLVFQAVALGGFYWIRYKVNSSFARAARRAADGRVLEGDAEE